MIKNYGCLADNYEITHACLADYAAIGIKHSAFHSALELRSTYSR